MTKTLELIFVNAAGGKVTLRVADPKDNLVESEVRAVMDQIVARDIFTSTGGSLVGVAGARIVSRDVAEMDLI
ncbi:hypothetical protein Desca_2564 [Desulfotomaculum nigrificans CO-1-SRB]|uniref:DUF2922 domain-containing protein n=1 Tax=Desulfotomaculum nigrificans (strain DSM 14880 / VKM B-2319 / CO-1-SRB) TaxID=868595 RepID=F6B514_DESCC|nr:DUF2922 domain-containing protein [Desulfotomaculum nigrificans]AEF95386.1 hypothetical protein Desca_2564 [Desulfotomaculum nigrificans CO-1-SRB]